LPTPAAQRDAQSSRPGSASGSAQSTPRGRPPTTVKVKVRKVMIGGTMKLGIAFNRNSIITEINALSDAVNTLKLGDELKEVDGVPVRPQDTLATLFPASSNHFDLKLARG